MDEILSISQFNEQGVNAKNEGMAYLTLSGRNYTLFFAKSVKAKVTKNKTDVRVLGRRSIGHKTTSWSGEGTLVIHGVTSFFKELFLEYVNKGVDRYFSLQITNNDPSTNYGEETKILTGCNPDNIEIADLENEDGILEQEIPFTFEGVELLEKYNQK